MGGVRDVSHTFSYRCLSCNRHFDNLESKKKHYKTCVGGGILDNLHFKFDVLKGKSFRNTSFTYDVVPIGEHNHLTNQSLWLMVNAIQSVLEHYQNNRAQYRAFKVRAVLFSDLTAQKNIKKEQSAIEDLINLNSFTYTCYPATNIKSAIIEPIYRDLVARLDEFEHRGSGWRLKTFFKLTITIDIINPLRVAACDSNEHTLPLNLAKKHALLQISYDGNYQDNDCFKWGVYASLFAQLYKDVGNTVSMSQLKEFAECLDLDFSMFEEWPINVWTDRTRPGMKLFEKFEDVNHLCLTTVSLSVRYQNNSNNG